MAQRAAPRAGPLLNSITMSITISIVISIIIIVISISFCNYHKTYFDWPRCTPAGAASGTPRGSGP